MGILTSCNKTSDTNGKNQEEVVEQKKLTDPRGKTLEDTSTGELEPQIVETVYETEDVVIADIIPTEMGYAVDPTGVEIMMPSPEKSCIFVLSIETS